MSSFDPSMEPMLEMFIYESTTLLEQLDEILLESEKIDSFTEDSINEIFRIMHTIKGSSAMMGIESISNLSHSVEDVFFIIRDNPAKLEHVNETLFDLVFQASDYLKAEVDAVQADDYTAKDPSDMIRQLEQQAAILKNAAAPPANKPKKPPAAPTPKPVESPAPVEEESSDMYQVRVFFEEGCQMENIRAFMLMSQLKDWCEELESDPPHPESDASVSSAIIKNGFLVKFIPTNLPEDVYKVIEGSINVKTYDIIDSKASKPLKQDVIIDNTPQAEQQTAAPSDEPIENTSLASSIEIQKTIDIPVAPVADKSISDAAQPKVNKQSLISVNQTKLDQLMDLVGELVTTESMVASNPDLKGLVLDNFHKSTRELRKLTDELQDVVMSIRMVPLAGVFQKMNRIVRDMSKKLNKSVVLETVGGETEVDKTINDSLNDPFMHMIRNSMDHAIESAEERAALGKPETGKVTIAAKNVGGEIIITISDDGRGLDASKIMDKARKNGILKKAETEYTDKEIFGLIMLPGFSTNDVVTEYSGRGVGMDVVRKNIEKVSGVISVDSEKNVGTVFTIKIPLTLAIVDGMEISVGNTIFTLPITSIKQSFKIFDPEQIIHNTDGSEMIMLRGECYPILRLHNQFNIPTEVTNITDGIVIQIENDNNVACIFADELLGEQQVVVKPFPVFLNRYDIKGNALSGCTILGDGSISLILDANTLLNLYER